MENGADVGDADDLVVQEEDARRGVLEQLRDAEEVPVDAGGHLHVIEEGAERYAPSRLDLMAAGGRVGLDGAWRFDHSSVSAVAVAHMLRGPAVDDPEVTAIGTDTVPSVCWSVGCRLGGRRAVLRSCCRLRLSCHFRAW